MFSLEELIIIIFASLVGFCLIIIILGILIHHFLKNNKNTQFSKNRNKNLFVQKYRFEKDAIQVKNIKTIQVNHFDRDTSYSHRPIITVTES